MITLVIIGVVAALTMPSLIQHHKKQEASARLKKFYSMINQAILLSEIDNGPIKDWVKEAMPYDEEGKLNRVENRTKAITYFNKYFASYMKYVKIDENPMDNWDENGVASVVRIYLADGSAFTLNNGDCIHFHYDINGDKKPNLSAKDRFDFLICPANYKEIYFGTASNRNFGPFCDRNCNFSRTWAMDMCKSKKNLCAHLLMLDNWEFKNDYPYKL